MGIKEASGDLKQVMDILRERPDDFTVLSGDDWLTLPRNRRRGRRADLGGVQRSSRRHDGPGPPPAIGDLEQARAWHYRLLPLMDANFLETNPAPVKAALHLMGRIQNVLRLPLLPVRESTGSALRTALSDAGVADV